MNYTAYRDMHDKLANLEPFKGNTARATRYGDEYEVYSYGTLIATRKNGETWVNPRRYSMTTSRLQNMIRRAWGVN